MRIPVVLAVVALTGACGVASGLAIPTLVDAPLVDADEGLAPLAADVLDARPDDEPMRAHAELAPPAHAAPATPGLAAPAPTPAPAPAANAPGLPVLLLPDGLPLVLRGDAATVPTGTFHAGAGSLRHDPVAPRVRTLLLDDPGVAAPSATAGATSLAPAPARTQIQTAAGHPYVAAGASAARAAAAAGLALGILAVAGLALYHRIRPHAALENETRKIIFDAVCAEPGLGVHAIAQKANVSYSTATYHLERLVGAGMIVMTPDGNKLCYYKNGGAFTEAERKILPIVKNEEARKLLEAILDTPGTYRAALAERLGVTATTINWHLKRLREAGLVDETRQGRNAYLTARVPALRDSFLSLATKVDATDRDVADRLRRYASAYAIGPSGA